MPTDSDGADKSYYLQYYKQKLWIAIMHTKVVICNCCIQKLSFAIVAYKSYCFEISSIDFSNMSKLILLDSLLQEVTMREIQIATYLIQTGLYFLIYSPRCLKFEYSIPSGFKGHSCLNQYEAWNMPKYIPIIKAYSIFSPWYFPPQRQICPWNLLHISPLC